MKKIHNTQILSWQQHYRTNLINALSGFKPVALVGTADVMGNTNLAVFNSLMHIGANPPLLGLIFRPDTVERHTLGNITSTGHYTINLVGRSFVRQAHQTSARYPSGTSEFEATGLQAIFEDHFPAPFVKESPVRIGLRLAERLDIQANGTHLIIGEIMLVELDEEVLEEDGHLRLDKADVVCCNGLDSYYLPQFMERLPYAKP